MTEIQNTKLDFVNRQYSITNILCIINPFSACQPSYLVSGPRLRVQGFTFNLDVDSIVLVIEYCNLRFICYLELVFWDFKYAPKPPPVASQSHVLRELILCFERHRARLPFGYCVLP